MAIDENRLVRFNIGPFDSINKKNTKTIGHCKECGAEVRRWPDFFNIIEPTCFCARKAGIQEVKKG